MSFGSNHQKGLISHKGLGERDNVFFAAVEMTRMPMLLTDPNQPDNPIVFANRAFLDLTGYEHAEIIGRNCRFLQGPGTDRELVREIREALREQKPISVELLNYRKDATPFWNALFIGPVFAEDGKLAYYFASQLDVSRRRSSEEAFRQSQKMEAIGQLTAGLAHDFNNMLQVITGNLQHAELQIAKGEAERARDTIAKADRAVAQAAKLTQQLLTFARKTRLEPRPVNLNQLLMDFGGMLSRTLGSSVELRLDLNPALPTCVIDPVHAEMALLNVLVNARDAMPQGGKVTISTGRVRLDEHAVADSSLSPGSYVALAVTDEGEGMPPEVVARAIEPFFTTKQKGRGTGLGLAMVHGFAQQSGGRLDIQSEAGRGSTVRLLFPESSEAVAPAPTPAAADSVAQGGSETILAVDDSVDVLESASVLLQSLGYRVIAAGSGEEALRILDAADSPQVDLLFTDIAMPGGMNGLMLAEQARRRLPALKVLLATGYIEDLVVKGPQASGMDVLGKPYRRSELADRVRTALERDTSQPAQSETDTSAWRWHEG